MSTYLAIFLLFPWILCQVLAQTCRSSYSLPNMKLKGHVIKTYSVANDQCVDNCASQAGCHSINYCSSQGICELNNASHLSNPESMVSSAGCQYLNYFRRAVSRCSNKLCNYPLECEVDSNGDDYKCQSCKDKHKVLTFPKKTTTDYVIYENPFASLTAFTISMWVQIDPSTDFHTLFSYATVGEFNELLFEFRSSKVTMRVNGLINEFVVPTFDSQWHHMCATWTNVGGNYSIYIDGISKGQGNKKAGHVIQKGAVVLGQDQDIYKGKFEKTSAFQGNMTSVNMWDKVFTADEVSALASRCSKAEGNIIKWTDFQDKLTGNLKLGCSRFCDG